MRIEGGFSIVFVDTFIEALGSALKASDDARGVSMIGTLFASAGHDQTGTGSLVEGSGTSVVSLLGGTVTGAADRSFVDAVTAHGMAMDATRNSASDAGQFGINSGEIVMRQCATVRVNGPGILSKITSMLNVGSHLRQGLRQAANRHRRRQDQARRASHPVTVPQARDRDRRPVRPLWRVAPGFLVQGLVGQQHDPSRSFGSRRLVF